MTFFFIFLISHLGRVSKHHMGIYMHTCFVNGFPYLHVFYMKSTKILELSHQHWQVTDFYYLGFPIIHDELMIILCYAYYYTSRCFHDYDMSTVLLTYTFLGAANNLFEKLKNICTKVIFSCVSFLVFPHLLVQLLTGSEALNEANWGVSDLIKDAPRLIMDNTPHYDSDRDVTQLYINHYYYVTSNAIISICPCLIWWLL